MIFYIVKTSTFIKIGISENFDNRFKSYLQYEPIDYSCYDITKYSFEIGGFLEISLMHKFKSETEFLYKAVYEDVKRECEILLNNIVYFYFFLNPLNINLICINNTYYDFKPAINYVNNLRLRKGKSIFKMADYLKKKETREFASIVAREKNLKYAIFSKCGKGGSTYGSPEMLFDFLISADIDIKYDILNWSLKDKLEYKNFLLCIK